ncbi:MAG TPA: hypothetical protein VNZ22_05095, partial [Bacillota bacterium]|nr:hypothetical protein [Bacillota bacterium]
MNETPTNFWKQPLRGPVRLLACLALAVAVTFIIVYGIALGTGMTTGGSERVAFALIVSLVMVGLVTAGVLAVRWLCSWRNLRRALFGAACVLTLLVLAYAEENWRGHHAWQKHRRQWEAKGEKFGSAAMVPPAVPDEKNFALTPLLKPVLDLTQGPTGVVWHDTNGIARLEKISADLSPNRNTNDHLVLGSLEKGTFADLRACAEFYRGNTNYPQCANSGPAAETILVALGKFDAELQELHQAALSRPYARFPVQWEFEPPWAILLPHLARVKMLTTLVQVRATAELEAGRSPEAFEDWKLGWRLSDSIHQEPILIDHLVRVATLAIDLQTLREGLLRHAWTEAQLAELESHLNSVDLLAEYKLAMRGERALTTGGLDYLRRQGFRNNPMDYLGTDGGVARTGLGFNLMPSGWFYQNMLTMSELFQDYTLST